MLGITATVKFSFVFFFFCFLFMKMRWIFFIFIHFKLTVNNNKGISIVPVYHTQWAWRALYNNKSNTQAHWMDRAVKKK